MQKNKTLFTILGFLMAGIGFLALVLSVVGVQLSFLTWLDAPGRLFGFVGRLVMIIVGFVMVYLARTDFSQEEAS